MNMDTNTQIATRESESFEIGWSSGGAFAHTQRVAKMLSASSLVPKDFQGEAGISNCVIALNMAQRLGADPLAVMQSIYIVYGKPAWASTFVIAMINSSGLLKGSLKWKFSGAGDDYTCIAYGTNTDGEVIEGPPVSVKMAKDEGWFTKNGSKWKTMPDLMLRYRAATFFGRMYAPEKLLGMHTQEEVLDTVDTAPPKATPRKMYKTSADTGEPAQETKPETPQEPTVIEAEVVQPKGEPPKADPPKEEPPKPAAQPASGHPRDEVVAWANSSNIKFSDLKRWNATLPIQNQIGSLGADARGFEFMTRVDSKTIMSLRHPISMWLAGNPAPK